MKKSLKYGLIGFVIIVVIFAVVGAVGGAIEEDKYQEDAEKSQQEYQDPALYQPTDSISTVKDSIN